MVRIRAARLEDVRGIMKLVNRESARSLAVMKISEREVERWIEAGLSLVAVGRERIVGHQALNVWPKSGWAELRSAVVEEGFRGRGLGYKMTKRLMDIFLRRKPDAVFIAIKNRTERGVGILLAMGFKEIDLGEVPKELWSIRSYSERKAFIARFNTVSGKSHMLHSSSERSFALILFSH